MMNSVGDKKKASEFLLIAEKMKKMLESVANGVQIDILKVDPPVTPSVILGMKEEERLEKFNAVYAVYNSQFEEHKSKAQKCVEGAKNKSLK